MNLCVCVYMYIYIYIYNVYIYIYGVLLQTPESSMSVRITCATNACYYITRATHMYVYIYIYIYIYVYVYVFRAR